MSLLNLLALASLLICGVAGVIMLARAMARATMDPRPRCVACGQDAAALTSFICPGCGADVRLRGLRSRRRRTPAGVLAIASAIGLLVLLLAGITMLALPESRTQERNLRIDVSFSPAAWTRPKPFSSVHATLAAIGAPGEPLKGTLWLDLTNEDANASILEVSLPSREAKMYPLAGGAPRDAGRMDPRLIERWMDDNGIAKNANREQCLQEILPGIESLITVGEFPRALQLSFRDRPAMMISGGGGGSVQTLRSTIAYQVAIWPLVCLALLWMAFRLSRTRDDVGAPIA